MWLGKEIEDRNTLCARNVDVEGRVHADPGPRIFVCVEEMNELVTRLRRWRAAKVADDRRLPARCPALDVTDRVHFTGRQVKVHACAFPVILERVVDNRPEADRILIARLHGTAKHHARWRGLTVEQEATAVAAVRELAAGRADLLAQVAGILEGFSEGELDEPRARQAARLCREAGADPEAIPAWIEEGRRRREAARLPPFSAPRDRRPRQG